MRLNQLLFLLGILSVFCSCRSNFETVDSKGNLGFSSDTIYLETIFSNISSSTYQLKVYNKSTEDINIPVIQLGKGLSSKYRMTVDGMSGNQGKIFENISLLAKDSLYIFVEATANSSDTNTTDFLYTDQIEFDRGANLQKVALVSLVKEAVFLFPQRFADGTKETISVENEKREGFYLEDTELHFTNKKAYVIYGTAAVPPGKTAIFDAGARVYFHTNSGLFVSATASIQINGKSSKTNQLENEVVFQGDRLESGYAFISDQWNEIYLDEGTTNSSIDHLTIKNSATGLYIRNNKGMLNIKNTQIYNSFSSGITAENATINAENLVVNNRGGASLYCVNGGNYTFTHCTFNNNWKNYGYPAVILDNLASGAVPKANSLSKATFNNCIIYGPTANELELNKENGTTFEYQFNHCLIKFDSKSAASNPLYQFVSDPTHYTGIILNQDPKFQSISKNKLNIDKGSPAVGKGNSSYAIPLDVLGTSRTLPPDLGAFQSKPFSD